MSSVVIAGDTSGSVTLQAPATAGSTTLTLPATSGNVLTSTSATVGSGGITFSDGSTQTAAASPYVLKNRIINGAMVIDQRNAGASVTNTAGEVYAVDRFPAYGSQASKFTIQQNAGSITPPAGFTNYVGVTSLSAYSVLAADEFVLSQKIEGFNVSDLGFGTANAKTVTLSFWVRSSLTGSFGGNLANGALTRAYPFSYTISAANTWEQKTITITGDTTGTWLTTNGIGLFVRFGLGVGSTYGSGTAGAWTGTYSDVPTGSVSVVGTNGATFYITGVQLEIGTTATPFERRLYGQELALCQRYYYKQQGTSGASMFGAGFNYSTTLSIGMITYPVQMRIAPTALEQSGTANNYQVYNAGGTTVSTSVPVFNSADLWGATVQFVSSSLSLGQGTILRAATSSGYLAWSAEL